MYNAINVAVAQWEIKSFQMHFEAARDVRFSKLQEIRFSDNNPYQLRFVIGCNFFFFLVIICFVEIKLQISSKRA